jgi:hypothetical protein
MVIIVFHKRRVLPLTQWVRRLDEMVPGVPLEGTVLVMEELDRKEIKKRIKLALRSVPSDTTLDLHMPMCPNDDFIEMVSALLLLVPLDFFPIA